MPNIIPPAPDVLDRLEGMVRIYVHRGLLGKACEPDDLISNAFDPAWVKALWPAVQDSGRRRLEVEQGKVALAAAADSPAPAPRPEPVEGAAP